MTRQEYLDLLLETSKSGRFPANKGRTCYYRTLEGKRCAIGLLIPPEHYQEELEHEVLGRIYREVLKPNNLVPEGMTLKDLLLVRNCHDGMIAEGLPWKHADFVARLKGCNVFRYCTFPAE